MAVRPEDERLPPGRDRRTGDGADLAGLACNGDTDGTGMATVALLLLNLTGNEIESDF